MVVEGWLELGVVLLLFAGGYLLIRRPLERRRLFRLANSRLKHERHPRVHSTAHRR